MCSLFAPDINMTVNALTNMPSHWVNDDVEDYLSDEDETYSNALREYTNNLDSRRTPNDPWDDNILDHSVQNAPTPEMVLPSEQEEEEASGPPVRPAPKLSFVATYFQYLRECTEHMSNDDVVENSSSLWVSFLEETIQRMSLEQPGTMVSKQIKTLKLLLKWPNSVYAKQWTFTYFDVNICYLHSLLKRRTSVLHDDSRDCATARAFQRKRQEILQSGARNSECLKRLRTL